MNNGQDGAATARAFRVLGMAKVLADLGRAELAYRQAIAASFTLTYRGAPDEVADARMMVETVECHH